MTEVHYRDPISSAQTTTYHGHFDQNTGRWTDYSHASSRKPQEPYFASDIHVNSLPPPPPLTNVYGPSVEDTSSAHGFPPMPPPPVFIETETVPQPSAVQTRIRGMESKIRELNSALQASQVDLRVSKASSSASEKGYAEHLKAVNSKWSTLFKGKCSSLATHEADDENLYL